MAELRKRMRLLTDLVLASLILVTGIAFPVSASAGNAVVVACSDYQYPNKDEYGLGAQGNAGAAIVVGQIAQSLGEAGVSGVEGLLCAGDYDFDLKRTAADTADGIASLRGALNASGLTDSDTRWVLVQGNHDPASTDGGTTKTGENDPPSRAYGVYVMNERDYSWHGGIEENVQATAADLKAYLDKKLKEKFKAPIFVITHLPLHYSMRTWYDGDARYSKHLFDVLNGFSAHGLNIIYLFGHDHSQGWDDYLGGPKVFLKPGEKINIADGTKTGYTSETLKFVYMNAGYTGYYKNHNTETSSSGTAVYDIEDLSMSCFVISDDRVVISRYSSGGPTVLKKAGVLNRYRKEDTLQNYPPNTKVVRGPFMRTGGTVTEHKAASGENVCSVCGMEFEPAVPSKVTGVELDKTKGKILAASSEPLPGQEDLTLQLKATVSPADAENKKVKWSTSDSSIAIVDSTGKVNGLKAGTVTITATTVDGGKQASCALQVLTRKEAELKAGAVYIFKSKLSNNYSMDIMYANADRNTNASLYKTDMKRAAQRFTVEKKKVNGKYWYLLTRKNSYVGRRAVTELSGRNLVFAVDKETNWQLFRAYRFNDGTIQFINRASNKAIAVVGGTAANRVNIAPAKADLGNGQRWKCVSGG